jgi:hypothetical protein
MLLISYFHYSLDWVPISEEYRGPGANVTKTQADNRVDYGLNTQFCRVSLTILTRRRGTRCLQPSDRIRGPRLDLAHRSTSHTYDRLINI